MASKLSFLGFAMSLLFLIGSWLIWTQSRKKKPFSESQKQQIKAAIALALMSAGYSERMARFWVAVSQFETGNFTSPLAVDWNNFFGMKWSGRSRSVTLYGSDWAWPKDLSESIALQVDYLKRKKYPKDFPDLHSFVDYMASVFYFGKESPVTYYNGLKAYL